MPLYDNVLNLVSGEIQNQKGLASIEQMKAETALRLAQGQQTQQQMEISNATRALMLADAAAQQNAPQSPVAATTADTPALPFADEYNAVKDNLATAKRMQAIARRAGDSAGMEKWNDNVREASNNLGTIGEKQYAEVQKQLQQKANIAAGVNDQESLNNASAAIGQQFGPQAKAKFDAAFMDPTAGIPVYNAAAQKKLNTMSTQFTDASKQASEKLALMQYRRQIAEDEQRVKHQTAQETHATRGEELAREGLTSREKDRALSRDLQIGNHADLQTQRAQTAARQIQNAYTAESKDFETKRDYFTTTAEYMRNPDGTPKPQAAHTPTGDQALADAYIAMIHPNYRGTIYELKNIDQLAGVPARIWQGIKTIAGGKELPGNIAEEMFATMSNQMRTINSSQQKKEASYMEQIRQLPEGKVDPKVWIRKKSIGDDTPTAAAPAGLPAKADLETGKVYPLPNGKQGKWNGSGFIIQ